MRADSRHYYIDRTDGVAGGRAVISESRIAVWEIVESYKSGLAAERILEHYPLLTVAKIFDALGYWYDNKDEIEGDLAANHPRI